MKETLSSYPDKATQGQDVLLTTRHHWLFLLFKMTRWSPFFDQVFPRQHRIDPRVVVVNPLVSIFHPNEDESELWWYSNRLKRIQTRRQYIVLFHCSPVLLFFQLLMHCMHIFQTVDDRITMCEHAQLIAFVECFVDLFDPNETDMFLSRPIFAIQFLPLLFCLF